MKEEIFKLETCVKVSGEVGEVGEIGEVGEVRRGVAWRKARRKLLSQAGRQR